MLVFLALFLGAGFSKPLGFPTMNEFFSAVADSRRVSTEEKNFLSGLILQARRANSFLESSPTNLEDVLSFAVMGDRLRLSAKENADPSETLLRILQKVYADVPDLDSYWDKLAVLETFLGFGPAEVQKHRLTFVTTNYDLNIEAALYRTGPRASLPFDFDQVDDIVIPSASHELYGRPGSAVPVYKLHGSVNWFRKPDPSRPDRFLVEDRVNDVDSDTGHVRVPVASFYEMDRVPFIVPPSFLKPDFLEPMQHVWTGAAKALNEADVLVFVGYSFPPSDTEMRYFLARSLVDNARLRKILIVDPMAESLVQRLSAAESRFGNHFRGLLQPLEGSWMDVTIKGLL
jgi:hypothetical protein